MELLVHILKTINQDKAPASAPLLTSHVIGTKISSGSQQILDTNIQNIRKVKRAISTAGRESTAGILEFKANKLVCYCTTL
ncbi:hypothetical protein FKM82_023940 [Ascaphus truei]